MKNIASLLSFVVMIIPSALASAGTVTPNASTAQTASVTATGIVTNGFAVQLSKGVGLTWNIDSTSAAVQSKHASSTSVFGGGTNGGSVNKCAGVSTLAATISANGNGCS